VIFEAGLALGLAASETGTIVVRLGRDVKLFSDAGAIHTVNLGNTLQTQYLLRDKLKTAGCDPDITTGDHLLPNQAGDFERCVKFSDPAAGDPFPTVASAGSGKPSKPKGDRKGKGDTQGVFALGILRIFQS
jgi:hypothetical protein